MASKKIKCNGCLTLITNKAFLTCALCSHSYDLRCANIAETVFSKTMTHDQKRLWECAQCKCKKPKVGNINTPLRNDGILEISSHNDDSYILSSHLALASTSGSCVNKMGRRKAVENSPPGSPYDDTVSLESIRSIIREELQQTIGERLHDMISKSVDDKVDKAIFNMVKELKARIVTLETTIAQLIPAPNQSIGSDNEVRPLYSQSVARNASSEQIKVVDTVSRISLQPPPSVPVRKGVQQKNLPQDDVATGVTPVMSTLPEEWVEVKRVRRSNPGIMRGTAAPGKLSLEACERWKYLHLYYVKMGTTVDQVRSHLAVVCGSDVCTVEALKARGQYTSFKLAVPHKLGDTIMSPENWPEDVCVKPWRQNFRANTKVDK